MWNNMKTLKPTYMVILSTLFIVGFIVIAGCSEKLEPIPPESITELREYDIDGFLTVVGVGKWTPDGAFHIKSYNGINYDVGPEAKIYEGPVTLDSFKRVTE